MLENLKELFVIFKVVVQPKFYKMLLLNYNIQSTA